MFDSAPKGCAIALAKQGNSHNFTYMCENAQCNRTPRGIIQFPLRQPFLLLLFRLADSSPRLCSFPGAVFCASQDVKEDLLHRYPLSDAGLNFRSWQGGAGAHMLDKDIHSASFGEGIHKISALRAPADRGRYAYALDSYMEGSGQARYLQRGDLPSTQRTQK